jgi:hypothetical protein
MLLDISLRTWERTYLTYGSTANPVYVLIGSYQALTFSALYQIKNLAVQYLASIINTKDDVCYHHSHKNEFY